MITINRISIKPVSMEEIQISLKRKGKMKKIKMIVHMNDPSSTEESRNDLKSHLTQMYQADLLPAICTEVKEIIEITTEMDCPPNYESYTAEELFNAVAYMAAPSKLIKVEEIDV